MAEMPLQTIPRRFGKYFSHNMSDSDDSYSNESNDGLFDDDVYDRSNNNPFDADFNDELFDNELNCNLPPVVASSNTNQRLEPIYPKQNRKVKSEYLNYFENDSIAYDDEVDYCVEEYENTYNEQEDLKDFFDDLHRCKQEEANDRDYTNFDDFYETHLDDIQYGKEQTDAHLYYTSLFFY